jgi:hypothetical protein
MRKRQEITRQFLLGMVPARETFTLLARYPEASPSLQRIVRLPELMKANYLGWLSFENSRGANVYFSNQSSLTWCEEADQECGRNGKGTVSRSGFGR